MREGTDDAPVARTSHVNPIDRELEEKGWPRCIPNKPYWGKCLICGVEHAADCKRADIRAEMWRRAQQPWQRPGLIRRVLGAVLWFALGAATATRHGRWV